jgi:hypothetical protein
LKGWRLGRGEGGGVLIAPPSWILLPFISDLRFLVGVVLVSFIDFIYFPFQDREQVSRDLLEIRDSFFSIEIFVVVKDFDGLHLFIGQLTEEFFEGLAYIVIFEVVEVGEGFGFYEKEVSVTKGFV